MTEKNFNLYDSLYISDLEGGLRRGETGLSFILMSIFLFGSLVFTALNRPHIMPVFAADITNEVVGESKQTVEISAYVPSFLGLKKIGSNVKHKTLIAYGNSDQGFTIMKADSQETLFKYDAMPGEGIIIKLPDELEDLLFDSNF